MTGNSKFGPFSDIHIPPESSGPGIYNLVRYEIAISSASFTPLINDIVLGVTSNTQGTVINVREGASGTQWDISVILADDSPSLIWTDTETIDFNSGQNTGIVDSTEIIHTNTTILAGGNNPFNVQNIDKKGSASIRFIEGEQQFSSFGLARTVTPTIIGDHVFNYTTNDADFTDDIVAGGSLVYLVDESSVEYRVGTSSGDRVTRTSNLYHPYQPGVGRLIMMTVTSGDSGKANVRRRWGYYDNENGIYFEQNGTTDFNVVQRSFTSGSVVNTLVEQAAWNGDRVDGSNSRKNPSGFNLDVSKNNIYWLDLAWLGAGHVRFGIYDNDGTRITCHTFRNANINTVPWVTTATLPIRQEIENTGVAGSISSLKTNCIQVISDGDVGEVVEGSSSSIHSWVQGSDVTGITTETVIANFRAGITVNGITNRKLSIITSMAFSVTGANVILRAYFGSVLGGTPSWEVAESFSGLEVDEAGTLSTPGRLAFSRMVEIGSKLVNAPAAIQSIPNSLFIKADGTVGTNVTITAEALSGTATVQMLVNWSDIGQ